MPKILVVEDDESVALQVADTLRSQGHLVDVARNGNDARAHLYVVPYDLIILDWELPDVAGPAICSEIRRSDRPHVPVLYLTARSTIEDKAHGFESGADDYLTKPFHMAELLARTKALLKRPPLMQQRQIKIRDLLLDIDRHEVYQAGRKIDLYPKEFALLEFLACHPNQIFSADALLNHIWPTDSDSSVETVRVTLMRIRQKLDETTSKPLIVTLRNIGYRLEP